MIERLETDRTEIGQLAFIIQFGIFDHVQHVSVFRRQFRRKHAAIRKHEIVGGHRRAVRPLSVGPKVESVCRAIARNVPALRRAGGGVEILGIGRRQSFQQSEDDVKILLGINELRVEIGGLSKITKLKGSGAVTTLDGSFRRFASRDQG